MWTGALSPANAPEHAHTRYWYTLIAPRQHSHRNAICWSTKYLDKTVTAPAKGIPYSASTDGQAWPGLAGSEAITAQNDRDFSSGTIGNWRVIRDGSNSTMTTWNKSSGENSAGIKLVTDDSDIYASEMRLIMATYAK